MLPSSPLLLRDGFHSGVEKREKRRLARDHVAARAGFDISQQRQEAVQVGLPFVGMRDSSGRCLEAGRVPALQPRNAGEQAERRREAEDEREPRRRRARRGLQLSLSSGQEATTMKSNILLSAPPPSIRSRDAPPETKEKPVMTDEARSGIERRADPRAAVRTEMKIFYPDLRHLADAICRDISVGGMFVESPSPLAVGTEIRFDLHFPTRRPQVVRGDESRGLEPHGRPRRGKARRLRRQVRAARHPLPQPDLPRRRPLHPGWRRPVRPRS